MAAKPQFPAVLQSGAVVLGSATDTLYIVPALIADLGEPAAWRYVDFFAANIRNPNTRRAYVRACGRFFGWCEDRGLTLTTIRPFDVAAWVEQLQEKRFDLHREGPRSSVALRLLKSSKCGSWVRLRGAGWIGLDCASLRHDTRPRGRYCDSQIIERVGARTRQDVELGWIQARIPP